MCLPDHVNELRIDWQNGAFDTPVYCSQSEILQAIAMAKDKKLLSVYGVEPKGEPSKTNIAKRLKEGDGVPGCRLRTDGVRLEIK